MVVLELWLDASFFRVLLIVPVMEHAWASYVVSVSDFDSGKSAKACSQLFRISWGNKPERFLTRLCILYLLNEVVHQLLSYLAIAVTTVAFVSCVLI